MPPSSLSHSYLLRDPAGISTKTTSGTGARGNELRLEIRDEILGRLDPDREADEVRRRGEGCVGGGGVRHPRRHLDEALDAAERLREPEEVRRRGESLRLLRRLGEERHHAAEVPHLARGDRVAGVARQAGVEDALDARVLLECSGDLRRVEAVLPHPHCERLDPAQDEPAVERAWYRAERLL